VSHQDSKRTQCEPFRRKFKIKNKNKINKISKLFWNSGKGKGVQKSAIMEYHTKQSSQKMKKKKSESWFGWFKIFPKKSEGRKGLQ
jgi:hypothetical protein